MAALVSHGSLQAGGPAAGLPHHSTDLPKLDPAPAFELIDSAGARFSNSALRGNVWLAAFIFTRCPGACPIMSANLKSVQDAFGPEAPLHVVGITVDPDHDTPEVLAAYLNGLGADASRWHLLHGPIEQTRALAEEGFKVSIGQSPAEHSTRFILVDQEGFIRGYYEGVASNDLGSLKADVAALLSQ